MSQRVERGAVATSTCPSALLGGGGGGGGGAAGPDGLYQPVRHLLLHCAAVK